MNDYKKLGQTLAELRKKNSLKQGDLAKIAQVSPNALSAFERHGQKIRSMDMIEALFEAVGYSFELAPKKKRSRLSMTGTR